MESEIDDVLAFWFVEATKDQWFKKNEAFDQKVGERFKTLLNGLDGLYSQERCSPWEGTPEGDLASILVLDQFPRNIFRGSAQAFLYDDKALAVVMRALDRKSDRALPNVQRSFVYMPLMHAENLAAQELSVKCFEERMDDKSNLSFAIDHRDIIAKFGRFPHRNDLLGRHSTPEEVAFLEQGGFSG